MPSMGMAHHSSAAGLKSPADAIRVAVVAAMEYAGALPATAMTMVSNVPRTFARRPDWGLPDVDRLLIGCLFGGKRRQEPPRRCGDRSVRPPESDRREAKLA